MVEEVSVTNKSQLMPFDDEEIIALPTVVNATDAGRILGVCSRTMVRLANTGALFAGKDSGRYLFSRDAVLAYAGIDYDDLLERVERRRVIRAKYQAEMDRLAGPSPAEQQKQAATALIEMLSRSLGASAPAA